MCQVYIDLLRLFADGLLTRVLRSRGCFCCAAVLRPRSSVCVPRIFALGVAFADRWFCPRCCVCVPRICALVAVFADRGFCLPAVVFAPLRFFAPAVLFVSRGFCVLGAAFAVRRLCAPEAWFVGRGICGSRSSLPLIRCIRFPRVVFAVL